ncbi:SCO family protein [Caulobacter sp. RHG1]|uniref:SCO family protein n=1 Tax=Caulobacter sp. (strain RHG1) TaxID=2545762 RepID=UPI0015533480|nr:SCO family protein [Caulobacter sp. RHG1]NQE60966.1 Cytochrome oxidase biogenesis protein Sco1/SenC/PrrC, thiol-disulfide reductase [Caulobacter sp. RHG1]
MRGLVLALGLCVLPLAGCGAKDATETPKASVQIGGPFNLVDQDGKPVTEKDLLGKPTAVFFGFTYCPEVCPTTLTDLTAWLKALGPDADKLNVVFVSVDPERDTPQQLKLYLSNFDPHIRGLTGTPDEIAKTAKAYRVYYQKVPQDGGEYTIDHSSAIYLFDRKGTFVAPIGYQSPPDMALAQLRRLIKG